MHEIAVDEKGFPGEYLENEALRSEMQVENTEHGEVLKCKICGAKFDNEDAFEGHFAAGHIYINNPSEEKASGLGQLAKDSYMCEVCGRGFATQRQLDTHRLQH